MPVGVMTTRAALLIEDLKNAGAHVASDYLMSFGKKLIADALPDSRRSALVSQASHWQQHRHNDNATLLMEPNWRMRTMQQIQQQCSDCEDNRDDNDINHPILHLKSSKFQQLSFSVVADWHRWVCGRWLPLHVALEAFFFRNHYTSRCSMEAAHLKAMLSPSAPNFLFTMFTNVSPHLRRRYLFQK